MQKTVYEYTNCPEVLTSEIAGAGLHQVEIKDPDDIWNIPEAGYIVVRGLNKVYDEVPFQFRFYNQLRQIHMEVPVDYLNSLKENEDEFLDEEGKKHTFDRFMDSIELTGEKSLICEKYCVEDIKALVSAIADFYDFKESEDSDIVYKNKVTGTIVNVSAICKKVVENYKKSEG